MSKRYILIEHYDRRDVPRCDLPGSPFPSRKAALKLVKVLDAPASIQTVKRRTV
jgi:hypothetical protein